jgi:hypothetical protein
MQASTPQSPSRIQPALISSPVVPTSVTQQSVERIGPTYVDQKTFQRQLMVGWSTGTVGLTLRKFRPRQNPVNWYTPSAVPGEPGMMRLNTGEIVAAPPDDDSSSPEAASDLRAVEAENASSVCLKPDKWVGTTPPACTNTGAFRRVYSSSGNYGIGVQITLPQRITTMPPGPDPKHGDTGFIYLEGWTGPGSTNYESGLMYSAKHNWYTFYMRGATIPKPGFYSSQTFQGGQTLGLIISGYAYNYPDSSYVFAPFDHCSAQACVVATVGSQNPSCSGYCGEQHAFNAPGWQSNCCIFARMTTIGQTHRNFFSDGSTFGPIQWSSSMSMYDCSCWDGIHGLPWPVGGAQSWPSDSSRIVVTNALPGGIGETDVINLHG